jgi:transposase-like protein
VSGRKPEWPGPKPKENGYSGVPLAQDIQERIATLYGQGVSIHQISKQLGIGHGTAWNYVEGAKHSLPS